MTGAHQPSDDPLTRRQDSQPEHTQASQSLASAQDECLDDVTLPPGGGGWRAEAAPPFPGPAYLTSSGRDLRIDLLRGYFVLAMIVDHVRGPSPLYLLTGGNRFYTSAAEGFILTSGLVSGLVYRRLIDREGIGPSLFKILSRAATLYLLTIGVTLLFLPLSELLYLPWAQGVDLSRPLEFVISVLTLHRTYYLIDVMVLYTVLFLVSPLAFILLTRGKTWLLLGGSWLLWALFQFFPDYVALPWPIAGNYLFQFSAWQVLFFTGLALGCHHDRIPALQCRSTRLSLLLAGLGTLALIVLFFIVDTPTEAMPPSLAIDSPVRYEIRLWLHEIILAKADLRPGRIVASGVVFGFLFLSVTVYWRPLKRAIGWLLLPLGQHALYAYTAHIAITALVAIVLAPFKIASPGPQWLNAVIQVLSVLIIWWMIRRKFLAPTPATRRLWYASPAVIAILILIGLTWFPTPSHPGLTAPPADTQTAQARLARIFGTPIPPEALAGAPTSGLAAAPTPPPRPMIMSDGVERVSAYLGDIEGSLHERWFYSPQLDRDMPYYIYLPPDYGTAGRRYPVLYMLHGGGGHREEWVAYNLIDTADEQIRTGHIAPMIIVLPQGDRSYWINHADNGPRWGDYVARDLVRHIDNTYRTLRSPSARAIGGLSMGGWGALYHAFYRPDIFGIVGAHSPSFRSESEQVAFLGAGDEFARKDPLILARQLNGLNRLQIWLDAGDQDPWLPQLTELHQILTDRGIEHYWQTPVGGHDWKYWREQVLDYVRFYGRALSQQ